jgi:hypothetical protein
VNQGALLRSRPAIAAIIGPHEVNACLMESLHRVRCPPIPRHISQQCAFSLCAAGAGETDCTVLCRYRYRRSASLKVRAAQEAPLGWRRTFNGKRIEQYRRSACIVDIDTLDTDAASESALTDEERCPCKSSSAQNLSIVEAKT